MRFIGVIFGMAAVVVSFSSVSFADCNGMKAPKELLAKANPNCPEAKKLKDQYLKDFSKFMTDCKQQEELAQKTFPSQRSEDPNWSAGQKRLKAHLDPDGLDASLDPKLSKECAKDFEAPYNYRYVMQEIVRKIGQ